MFSFFQKKINKFQDLKRNKVVRSLPKPYVCKRAVVNKKKAKMICRPNFFYVKIAMWFLGMVFMAAMAYILFISQLLTVTGIEVRGNEKLASEDIVMLVESEMRGEKFDFFQNNNLIMVDTDKIERILEDKYRRIKKIKVYKKFPNKLSIDLEERLIKLIYCSAGDCFIIDEEGTACARADFDRNDLGERDLLVINDESGKRIQVLDFFMSVDFVQFILEIEKQLAIEGITINKVLSTPVLVSGDVRVTTVDGWKFFFNHQTGASEGVKMLKTVLKNILQEDQLTGLEYIDVRLPNKIYYKLKSSVEEGESSEQEMPISSLPEITKKDKKKK